MYYIVYGLFYVLSLLPIRALYIISDFLYFLTYYVFGYRKQVVMSNLLIAFPEKTQAERVRIAKKFYKNFIDSFIEVIKLISASEKFIQKRFTVDVSILEELYDTGASCQVHLGHTFNWEWGQLVLNILTRYKVMVVYMPITNKIFEKLFYSIRTRNGSIFLPATTIKDALLPYRNTQYLMGLVADQNPGNPHNSYWLNFFGRPTAFVTGPEKSARANKLPVVLASIVKPKRGYYHATIELATNNAAELPEGELTIRYVRHLENVIRLNPEMWLWTHRRWKHEWKEEYETMRIEEF